MNILKVIRKKQNEQLLDIETADNLVSQGTIGRQDNKPPELFVNEDLRVRVKESDSNKKNGSLTNKELSELKLEDADNAITDVFDLTRLDEKSLPEFASWNIDAERVNLRLTAITDPSSIYCEEYRSLRTQVLHKSQRQKLQSIVVASVNPGEGKSVTALNLAWLLAQTDGINALIIDSDLRMPSLTDYLGIETDKGLSDILAGRALLSDSIIKLEPSGLHLLPGGEPRNDVAELISGPTFKEILHQAREMFDYIIIDAPPLGIFTDATVLINHADGALLVVRADYTDYKDIRRVLETLPRERLLGGVLNQSIDVLNESHYNYSYYKGK